MVTAARTVEACRGALGRLPGRLSGLGAACPAARGCLDGTPCGLSESLWPCRHMCPPSGVSMRGPPRPTVLMLPGDLPRVQSPKVPEGRTAQRARPAGPCPRSAQPRTHAFLQLRIMRSCSPATALQAASSLVHCSWWVASARQGMCGAGCQPPGPGGTWVRLSAEAVRWPGFGRGVRASQPAFLAVGASSGHRPREWLVPTVTPALSSSHLNFLHRQERG